LPGASPEPVAWMVKASDENKLRRAIVKAGDNELPAAENVAGGFEKLTEANGETWYFGHHGEAVVYTHNAAVYELLAACRGSEKTFAGLVDPRAREMLHSGDGAVLVNVAKLTEIYGDELKQAREQAMRQIESLPDDMLGTGANAQAQRRVYLALAKVVFDGVSDASWAAGKLNLGAKGVNVSAVLAVKDGSSSDRLFASSPPTSFENLGLLPAGAPVYFGYFTNSEMDKTLMGGYTPEAANAKELEAAIDEATQSGAGASVSSFSLPADAKSGVVTNSLQQAEKPELLRSSKHKYQAAVGEVKTPIFTQSFDYQEAAETYKDRPVHVQTTKFELAKSDDVGVQIAQKLLERLFGGSALQTRITALEGLLVQASGNDPKFIHQVVDVLDSGEDVLGLNEAFAKTRDQLPEQANLLVMFNVPQLIVDFVKILREVPPLDMFLAQAPFNFGAQPAVTYAAISLGTESQGLRLQVFVPIEQPKGVMQIFGQD
jgi:hypothetical protein